MNAVVEMKQGGALASTNGSGRMAVSEIIQHVAVVQEVMRAVMKGPSKEHPDGVHYGVIPGTNKPTLLKPGAELLCMVFRIADSYQIEDLSTADTVRYRVTCTGTHQITGAMLGTGMGEASSGEEKYKWRKAYKEEFEATPASMRREKKGWDKIKKQNYAILQVRTEPADLANTILKMANKRAKMAMVLNVTAASDCFAQDLEDMDEALRDHLTRKGEDAGEGGNGSGNTQPGKPALPGYTEDEFTKNVATWQKVMNTGKPAADVLAKVKTVASLTPEQEAFILSLKPQQEPAAAPAPAPAVDPNDDFVKGLGE